MRMFITSKNKYLANDMKIFGACSIPLTSMLIIVKGVQSAVIFLSLRLWNTGTCNISFSEVRKHRHLYYSSLWGYGTQAPVIFLSLRLGAQAPAIFLSLMLENTGTCNISFFEVRKHRHLYYSSLWGYGTQAPVILLPLRLWAQAPAIFLSIRWGGTCIHNISLSEVVGTGTCNISLYEVRGPQLSIIFLSLGLWAQAPVIFLSMSWGGTGIHNISLSEVMEHRYL